MDSAVHLRGRGQALAQAKSIRSRHFRGGGWRGGGRQSMDDLIRTATDHQEITQ